MLLWAQLGQRAFVGLTAMDRNSPSDYCLSAATNIANARSFISYVRQASLALHCRHSRQQHSQISSSCDQLKWLLAPASHLRTLPPGTAQRGLTQYTNKGQLQCL